jgi:capsular exopolysaccharide synthesis family protein
MLNGKRDDFSQGRQAQVILPPSSGLDQQELSLAGLWGTIYKRKSLVFWPALVIFACVAIYTFTKTPVYESVASVQIDPNRSSDLGLDSMLSAKLGDEDASNELKTEVAIIQSDAVAMRVIKAMDLVHKPAFAGEKLGSPATSDPAEMVPAMRQALLSSFQGALNVRIIPATQLVEIRFRSTDPKLATELANSLIDEYMQRNLQTRYEGTVQVSNWLAKQMEDLQSKAVDAQKRLADYQKQNNIIGADENDNVVTDRLKLLNQQLADAEADRIVKEARHRLAASGNPELLASFIPTTTLQLLRSQQADLKAQLAQLSSKYGSGYPKVHELTQQLKQLDSEITVEVANVGKRLDDEYQSAAKTESLLRSQFEDQKREAFKLNEHAVQFAVLKHEVENGQQLYDTLQYKLKEAGVTAGLNSSYITVVDRAKVPAYPVAPRKGLNLALGLVGGLFVGLMFGFVVDAVDDSVRTFEEVEESLHLPAVGTIPYFAEKAGMKGLREGSASAETFVRAPIAFRHPHSSFAEACRAVCSGLLLSSIDNPPKTLVITSSFPQEGKSTISANLAYVFAQRGRKVLLIDADLRRPSIHAHYGLTRDHGLTSILAHGASESDYFTPIESVPNLKVLPAGPRPPAPAELLASFRMQELMATWTKEFDHVIIDSAPLLPVIDALSLSAMADGVVLVARAGLARKRALHRVMGMLARANANRLGVVLNAVDMQLEYYYLSSKYGKKYGYKNYYDELPADTRS